MRIALIIENGIPVDSIVLPENNEDFVLPNNWVEVTGLDPQPGVGNGWTYVNGKFLPPVLKPETWDSIREERSRRLQVSDWTRMDDAPLSVEQKNAWMVYRQALRDIPQTFASPDEVVWPEAP